MGILEKLFGKSNNNETEKQEEQLDRNDIKNYKLIGLEQTEIEHIKENSKYLASVMPLFVQNLNETHIFYPDNLKKFANNWFNKDKPSRVIQMEESQMLEILSVGLGEYVKDTFGLLWVNLAFMQPDENGNITVEIGIVDQNYKFVFLPLTTFSNEIYKKDNSIDKELKRISQNFKPVNTDKSNLTFEELISEVKKNGNGEEVFKIWEKVFGLEKWNFISTYKEDIQQIQPFIGVLNNEPWLFMFTSKEKANEFAKTDNRFQGPNGETYVISQPIENSFKMFEQVENNGVVGVMVNMNDEKINANFNIPFKVLKKIKEQIEKEK